MRSYQRIIAALLATVCLFLYSYASAHCLLVIEPQELAQMLDEETDALYVDLRSEKEYNQMHIPGFILLEYSEEAVLALAEYDCPIILICQTGVRSARAFNLLVTAGRDNIRTCIFGVADYAETIGEERMEGDNICIPCLLQKEDKE